MGTPPFWHRPTPAQGVLACLSVMWYVFTRTDNKYTWPTGRQHIHRSARSLKAEHPRSTGARLPVVLVCTLPAPRQIHDAGRPSHVIPMAIHRSVHEAKGAGCGRLPGTVVALGSSGSSASLRKMRHDFIPPRRCQSTPQVTPPTHWVTRVKLLTARL